MNSERATDANADRVADADTQLEELRERLRTCADERSEERRRLTDHLLRVQSELNVSSRERRQLREELVRRRQEAEEQRLATAQDLREMRWKASTFRHERDLAQWKLGSLQQRKWWRVGLALGTLRRQPWRLLSVLLEVLRIARSSSPPPPRPAKPADLLDPPELSTLDVDASPDERGPRAPVRAPSHLLAVATALHQEHERDFGFEWVSQPLDAENWREILHDATPDLLLISDLGWSQLQASSPEVSLDEVVGAFRDVGVPTAFWDTRREASSPAQTEIARRFDTVLCSFASTVEAYRSVSDAGNVVLFAPAVQTRRFRPTGGDRDGGVLGLRSLAAPDGDSPLARAARTAVGNSFVLDEVSFPGSTDDESAATRARDYKAATFRISAATDEREVRELLEVVATQTIVLADGAIPEELGGTVFDATTHAEAAEMLKTILRSDELRARLAHRARRQVQRDHAVAGRVDELLHRLGLAEPARTPRLAMMVPTNRPHKLTTILDNLARQTYPNLSTTLVLHGVELDEGRLREMADQRGLDRVELLRVREEVALGEVFNRGFAACDGEVLGKMDDDDYYGPEYASDLMADLETSSADIVGKWTHYSYSQALNATLLRYPGHEHSFVDLLAISTLLLRPSVLESTSFLPMERGSGSQFLRAAGAEGARVYAGNRFNYLYNRYSGDGHQHTWPVGDYEFAARAEFICQGQNLSAVEA